jgi:inner membrane protein
VSKTGHVISGVALGIAAIHFEPKAPVLAVAAFIGALLPDAAEGVFGWWGNVRWSLIPHRTLTHWAYLYIGILCATVRLQPTQHAIAIGLCLGSLLHIGLDAFSPMGIPLGSPFGERTSIRFPGGSSLYHTGALSEMPLWLALFALAGVACLIP